MLLNDWFNPYLVAPVIAWLVAQFLKMLWAMRHQTKKDYSIFFKSGSMPSSHTATMISLSTTIAMVDGVNTAVFGIAAIVSAVVIYDALNVRRAVGEQGPILKRLAKQAKIADTFYMARGHVGVDVAVGSVIGILASVVVLFILK